MALGEFVFLNFICSTFVKSYPLNLGFPNHFNRQREEEGKSDTEGDEEDDEDEEEDDDSGSEDEISTDEEDEEIQGNFLKVIVCLMVSLVYAHL